MIKLLDILKEIEVLDPSIPTFPIKCNSFEELKNNLMRLHTLGYTWVNRNILKTLGDNIKIEEWRRVWNNTGYPKYIKLNPDKNIIIKKYIKNINEIEVLDPTIKRFKVKYNRTEEVSDVSFNVYKIIQPNELSSYSIYKNEGEEDFDFVLNTVFERYFEKNNIPIRKKLDSDILCIIPPQYVEIIR